MTSKDEGLDALVERITEYLCVGGFWNPESMQHDKVRDLLIDVRAALAAQPARDRAAIIEECAKVCDDLQAHWTSPYGTTTWPYAFEKAAAAIRALPKESRDP